MKSRFVAAILRGVFLKARFTSRRALWSECAVRKPSEQETYSKREG